MSNDEAKLLIDQIVSQLGEHFEAVQIMVSWNEEAKTMDIQNGCGNWYARQGMAHEFINTAKAQLNAHEMKRSRES